MPPPPPPGAPQWAEKFKEKAHLTETYGNEQRDAWLLVLSLQRAFYLAQFEAGLLVSGAFYTLEAHATAA